MEGKERFELVLINNPEYMGELSSEIEALAKKLTIEGITPQSLWRHLYQSIQRYTIQVYAGTDPAEEFWAVFNKEKKAIAFAHWFVMGLPYNGTVFCDFIYSWNTSREPTSLLIDKCIEFGKRHGCVWYKAVATNERVYTVFKKALKKRGMKCIRQNSINFIGRR